MPYPDSGLRLQGWADWGWVSVQYWTSFKEEYRGPQTCALHARRPERGNQFRVESPKSEPGASGELPSMQKGDQLPCCRWAILAMAMVRL